MTFAALAASEAAKETASTRGRAGATPRRLIAFGRTAMIGVPALTVEWTVTDAAEVRLLRHRRAAVAGGDVDRVGQHPRARS